MADLGQQQQQDPAAAAAGGTNDTANPGNNVFSRDTATHPSPGTDCQESVFVQWLSLIAFPDSTRILSDWTAGCGQTSLGSDHRQRVDACASIPLPGGGVRLAFVNYNGQFWHSRGRHDDDCPRRPAGGSSNAEDGSDVASPPPAAAAAAAEEEEGGSASRWRLARDLEHKRACHRHRPQTLYWPGSGGKVLTSDQLGARATKDEVEDECRKRLAAAMTQVATDLGLKILVTFHVVTECQLMHKDYNTLDIKTLLDAPNARHTLTTPPQQEQQRQGWSDRPRADGGQRRGCVRRHLETYYPNDIILGPPPILRKPFTQQQLVDFLMSQPDNSAGGRVGGFLLVRGGRLLSPDDNQGYCVQRVPTALNEVGRFTHWQARHLAGGGTDLVGANLAEQMLTRYCSNELTVARRSFPDSGELVGVDYFKWLVKEKQLSHYVVSHYLFFPHALYLSDFFLEMAQRRHDIQRADNGAGVGGVEEMSLKQLTNSAYGHRYTTTTTTAAAAAAAAATMPSPHCFSSCPLQLHAGHTLHQQLRHLRQRDKVPPDPRRPESVRRDAAGSHQRVRRPFQRRLRGSEAAAAAATWRVEPLVRRHQGEP